jgi:hypothetical protein
MKIFYLLVSVLSLLLIGCSSTYKISDFPSKDKFYEDFNNFASIRNMDVTLKNDSTFNVPEGSKILDDKLVITSSTNKEQKIIAKNDIKNIYFYFNKETRTASANIILKKGGELKGDNVEYLPDSTIRFMVNRYEYLSLNSIKEISYKNRWLGSVIDFLIGIPFGFAIGSVIYSATEGHNQNSYNQATYNYGYSLISGPILGGIMGAFIGYKYTYIFNP